MGLAKIGLSNGVISLSRVKLEHQTMNMQKKKQKKTKNEVVLISGWPLYRILQYLFFYLFFLAKAIFKL